MTGETMVKAANVLLRPILVGEKMCPKLYVVHGEIYWTLNAARRANGYWQARAKVNFEIEEMTIQEAWKIAKGREFPDEARILVDWDYDTVGADFDGRLYCIV